MIGALILRDLRRGWRGGGVWMPVAFFLLVATLFPFAIGPEGATLARIGPGAAWVAALLAALLPIDRLIAPDIDAGVIDQLAVRGASEEAVAAAKIAAHWAGFGPPLMIAAIPAAALLRLPGEALWRLEIALLIGTPGLAALAVATAALIAGLRGAGALAGLVMLPVAVPLLIFAAGDGPGAMKLLAATSLAFVGGAPFVAGAAIRSARGA